ncbi:MAG TPA: leucine--tRNA ligase, partial [Solirubrobacterales bacterium]|nr:leucine--tRNA ligase [Solirubrobacterales bacterium]
FLQLFERGLAYRTEAAVQWCPKDATVLANEQVIDGRCERCGTEVIQKKLEQWFFKITDYADRLLEDFDALESWPDHVITMQRNWIGRSEGAEVVFRCDEVDLDFPVFTTRPDTLFGATFFVLAPEHPQLEKLVAGTPAETAVREYVDRVGRESAEERGDEDREKTGVPLGRSVVNPVNGEEIPMFVADYVLMEYGTGAIMAVPGHDSRDYDFAKKFDLPVRRVIEGRDPEAPGDSDGLPYTGDGPMVNSGRFDGQNNRDAYAAMIEWLSEEGRGKTAVNYRLRDWLLSRQRYWGAPIPIVYCEECGTVPVPADQLPVELPEIEDYAPHGKSPLAAATDWVTTTCPKCGGAARRETDTMDTFVDSSWYYIRYLDPHNEEAPFGKEAAAYWMPVDQYIGGVEHAILHLMYARFVVKALADLGHLEVPEPFANLFTQGMITRDGAKMSKSRGNTVSPAEYVERYGADTSRTYVCFMGPPERGGDWSDEGVEGVNRFLSRLWRLCDEVVERSAADAWTGDDDAAGAERLAATEGDARALVAKAHWSIDKATHDFERGFQFNTVIAAVMELVNDAYRLKEGLYGDPAGDAALRFATATAASLIFPFAPHIGSEVYERIAGERVWERPWPVADEAMLVSDTVEIVVQVNGKLRDRIAAPAEAEQEAVLALAKAGDKVARHLDGKQIVKEIFVPGKLVNLVVR